MRKRSVVTIGMVVAFAATAPGPALAAPLDDEGLPNVDRRSSQRAVVPGATRAARSGLERELGPLGDVRTDAKSGGVAYVGRTDGLLTDPSDDAPREIVLDYVRAHGDVFGLGKQDVANLRLVARSVSPDGIVHLRFNQVLDGILAFDSGIDGHVTADGRLVNVSGAPVPGARLSADATTPELSASAGLAAAREAVDGSTALPRTTAVKSDPARTTSFAGGERALLRWSATADGPRLAWNVIADDGDGRSYDVLVDADSGALLRRQDLTSQLGETRYFRVDPATTPVPTQITMPPAWYDDHAGGTRLWGEYSRTYVDPDDQDPAAGSESGGTRVQIPASGGAPASPDWLFRQSTDFPGVVGCPATGCTWNGVDRPSAVANQLQVAANVHVLVSRYHDHLAQAPIGFDEASGNFQLRNTSGSGLGNDYVRAEVNDGEGFNNANFSTPSDGQAPRMQMYLFRATRVNGGDVADIVYHEYGHGLSSRLVVNASGGSTLAAMQGQQMGEAWSDFYGLDLLVGEGDLRDTAAPAELTVGAYATGPGGIRSKPIDCPVDPAGATAACNRNGTGTVVNGGYTYADIAVTNNTSPHNGSEVWAETLWEIRSAVGRQAALALITGGMRISVDNPSMLDMRDAILQQAIAMRSAPGAADDHYARLWSIFRGRGMGADARTASAASTTPTEGNGAPAGVTAGKATITDPYPGGDNDGTIEPGEVFQVSQPLTGVGIVDLPGVTATLSTSEPSTTITDATAAWPLLGLGRTAANADALSGRVAAGACTTTSPLTISVSSSEGTVQARAVVDPRLGSNTVVRIADKPAPAGSPDAVTTASFVASGSGNVTDVDLRIDELRHTFLGDLRIELLHAGVSAFVINNPGGGGYNGHDIVGAVFDSDSATPVALPAGGPIAGRSQPQTANALDVFDGHPAAGTWTLRITDTAAQDTGELRRWGLDSGALGCGRVEIPAATTTGPEVSSDAATLHGSVTPNGRATGLRFAWGTTTAYGQTTATDAVGAGDAAVAGSAALNGLTPSTTYHYRVEAIRENGQVAVSGADQTFSTPPKPIDDPGPGGGGGGGGSGGGGGTPPGQLVEPFRPVLRDLVAPALSGPRVTLVSVSRRSSRRRATIAFSLSEPATVTATVTRAASGIRKGRACVAVPRRRPRAAKPCTRQLPAASARANAAKSGPATLRLPPAGLQRGAYTVTLTATDAAGNRSKPATVRFTVR